MTDSKCVWCDRETTDGREVSGFAGEGPDPMIDGDFGCDASPETDENGVGSHLTRESFRHLEANAVRFSKPLEALKRVVPWLGTMIANEGHLECVAPNAAVAALAQASAAIAATEKGETR